MCKAGYKHFAEIQKVGTSEICSNCIDGEINSMIYISVRIIRLLLVLAAEHTLTCMFF